MRAKVAGLVAVLAHFTLSLQAPPTADACGVKLSVKPSAPRKAVARSSTPSPVLLVGSPPRRLERDLTQAGHKVERAPDTQSAKNAPYSVVIVDSNEQAKAAKERFPKAAVIIRSGDMKADIASVETSVTRTPINRRDQGTIITQKENRVPIKVGPDRKTNEIVTAKPAETPAVAAAEPTPTPTPVPTPTPAPKETPKAVTAETTPKAEVKAPKAEAKVAVPTELHQEVTFGLGSAKVGNAKALQKAVAWLNANADASLTLGGHADPSGTAEGNMALSQARAEAVRDFLVGKGVDASRIEVKAFGDTQLKYGRADGRNRRVAIDATP